MHLGKSFVKSESDVFDYIELGDHFSSGNRLIDQTSDFIDLILCTKRTAGAIIS